MRSWEFPRTRKSAIKNHPDKGGDPEKFKKLGQAYESHYPITGITEMELDECEETTLHDVNIEEKMRRKQQQQAQEAYEEDDDMHGRAQRVLLKGYPYFKKLLEKEGGGNTSTTPDHPSEESSAIPSGALVSVVVGDRRRESTMPRSLEPYQAAFNSTLFSGTDSCLADELFVRFFASHRTVDNSFAGN
nr:dnaJ protein homolog [Ipomoea trifida]